MQMPALLLELGYLTHPEDAWRCLSFEHQEKTATAIILAIQAVKAVLQ
jgi:N-acetylmuramoyl-L-alanine amidase